MRHGERAENPLFDRNRTAVHEWAHLVLRDGSAVKNEEREESYMVVPMLIAFVDDLPDMFEIKEHDLQVTAVDEVPSIERLRRTPTAR